MVMKYKGADFHDEVTLKKICGEIKVYVMKVLVVALHRSSHIPLQDVIRKVDAPTVVGSPGSLFRCILFNVLHIVWTVDSINLLAFKCQHLCRRFIINSRVCFVIVTALFRKYNHNFIYLLCCISHRYVQYQKLYIVHQIDPSLFLQCLVKRF